MIKPRLFQSLSETKIWKDAIGIECNIKKVLCSAEKSSIIWAERHSSCLAEQFGQTERSVGHYCCYLKREKAKQSLHFSHLPGSFHLSFFVICPFWQWSYQNQLSFSKSVQLIFSFFVKTKNERWTEPDSSDNSNKKLLLVFVAWFLLKSYWLM